MIPKVSVVIPVFNEDKKISECLRSLKRQTLQNLEIIVVDDGSTDASLQVAKKFKVRIFEQKHFGPGSARNLGSKKATGEILVFVDADMTFDEKFIEELIKPIVESKTIGTFSKNEFVSNSHNIWSKCWSINRGLSPERMIPENYPNQAPVFRAILKEEFDRIGGFDTSGEYTDDWSLSRKLGTKSQATSGAVYFHANPDTIKEVWHQARWIGRNSFISGTPSSKLKSIIVFSLPTSILLGSIKAIASKIPTFLIFKMIYNFAIFTSVIGSFFGEKKYK